MRKKYLTVVSLTALIFIVLTVACKKEYTTNGYLPPVHLPDSVTVTYGDKVSLELPAEYTALQQEAEWTVDVSNNDKVKVDKHDSLSTMLQKAITVDSKNGALIIDASKVYPNGYLSDESDVRLPSVYQVTLRATSTKGFKGVSTSFKLNVIPAPLSIIEIPATPYIPYGYSLYESKGTVYTIDYGRLDTTGTKLVLHQNGRIDGHISHNNHQVILDNNAGDPDKKHEWIYDLIPSLTKNGYTIAYRQFRAVLLPTPKFFYGVYYPEYDLSVLQNRVVIGLGNAYTSIAPVFNPEKYKGSFNIKAIQLNGAPFSDMQTIFTIDATMGKIKVAQNNSLVAGEYKITVNAVSTAGITLQADQTLVME